VTQGATADDSVPSSGSGTGTPRPLDWGRVVLFASAYFLAHPIAFFFHDSEKIIMAVWPADAVGLAALLLSPRRLCPG
jgi:hypothetical protein